MASFIEILKTATIELPAAELVLLLTILAVCLVVRGTRSGLIVAYVFTYRWGWQFMQEHQERYLFGYLVFGGLVGILTVVDMVRGRTNN